MNKLYTLLTIVFLSLVAFQSRGQEEVSIKEALNMAAEQQVLSQQIGKVYLALFNNLSEPTLYQERDKAIKHFQKNMDALKFYHPNDRIKNAITELREKWKAYKKVAEWSIDEDGCKTIFDQSTEMLESCKRLLTAYEEYARQLSNLYESEEMAGIVKLLRLVSRQQMYTHRMMMLFLAAKQGIGTKNAEKELEEVGKEFDVILYDLQAAPFNSKTINDKIMEMQEHWGALSKYMEKEGKSSTGDKVVNSMTFLSNELISRGDKLTKMYLDLGKKLSISKFINVVSHQNTLSQRIAKAYVAIAYQQQVGKYKRELNLSIDEFEKEMNGLIKAAPNKDIKREVGVVQTMWKNYRKMVTNWEQMDPITVGKVLEKSHIIMASCDRVARAVDEYAQSVSEYKSFFVKQGEKVEEKDNIAYVLNMAGMQRTYSQRVAVYYMMSALKQDANLSAQRLKASVRKYNDCFKLINTSSLNTPEIERTIIEAQKDWVTIEDMTADIKEDDIATMLERSETLYTKLDKLNKLYESRMDELLTGDKTNP